MAADHVDHPRCRRRPECDHDYFGDSGDCELCLFRTPLSRANFGLASATGS